MRKTIKRVGICFLLAAFVWGGSLLLDRRTLNEELIRLHVVANSDKAEEQKIKLQVRDVVLNSFQQELRNVSDMEGAKEYLRQNLPKIQAIANDALRATGSGAEAAVTLCREAFDTRVYDTFTLPAGVYESLRITIGAGEGKNWWCVVFPALCMGATAEEFTDTAAGAGFSDGLNRALTADENTSIRFYFLDVMGKLENMFFEG